MSTRNDGQSGNDERHGRPDPLLDFSGIPGVVYDPWIKGLAQWRLEQGVEWRTDRSTT